MKWSMNSIHWIQGEHFATDSSCSVDKRNRRNIFSNLWILLWQWCVVCPVKPQTKSPVFILWVFFAFHFDSDPRMNESNAKVVVNPIHYTNTTERRKKNYFTKPKQKRKKSKRWEWTWEDIDNIGKPNEYKRLMKNNGNRHSLYMNALVLFHPNTKNTRAKCWTFGMDLSNWISANNNPTKQRCK